MQQRLKDAFLSYGSGLLNVFGEILPVVLMSMSYAAALLLLPHPYSFWISMAIVTFVFMPGAIMSMLILATHYQLHTAPHRVSDLP